jgi:hypothetical protein
MFQKSLEDIMNFNNLSFMNVKKCYIFKSLFFLLLLTSCSSDEKDACLSVQEGGEFQYLFTNHFSNRANCASCHRSDTDTPGNFSTQASTKDFFLLQNSADPSNPTCMGIPLVTPSNPARSYLAALFVDAYQGSALAQFPSCIPSAIHFQSRSSLSTCEKNLITRWIERGAQ